MNRRRFLIKSAALLAGSFLGTSSFSKALAVGGNNTKPRMALIIDDIGYNRSGAMQFLEPGIPITFSILPRLLKSEELAREIQRHGHEIMLHQPMEPVDSNFDPGPGALYVGDGIEKIHKTVKDNITSVPFATGVNNHMGSKFTANPREINETLKAIKNTGLFFIDSLTSSRSIAYRTAKKLHMPAVCRNIFLDNVQDEQYILNQLQKLKYHAMTYGYGVGIGHPFPETAKAIKCFAKKEAHGGISFVHVSNIMNKNGYTF